jgi:pyruvate dehydrogenase E1 component beta subunit
MGNMKFGDAIEDALATAMARDERIIVFGEDAQVLHRSLYALFGASRVRDTPISESAFVGAAVTAAMAGLRPVVDVMFADFLSVAMDALLNQAAKLEGFTGGRWKAPLVVRTACGGGYGDAGQHEQSLWGWLAHIPGLDVVVPSTPADAGGLMLSALACDGPVIYLEHKLLSAQWLESVGSGGRKTVHYDVPAKGAYGPVPPVWQPLPIGKVAVRREGTDITLVSVGVGVHRALEAAAELATSHIEAEVIDLRSISPLDMEAVVHSVGKTGRLLVIDEDYERFGLSGELAAVVLEAGIPARYARVCTRTTIPYALKDEAQALPNRERIIAAALALCRESSH